MSDSKITFTNNFLLTVTCPRDKRRVIYYDKKVQKLALLVSKTGVKTFALHTYDRTRKKAIQQTIGRYSDISITKAREVAQKMLAEMADGVDIIEARKAIREENTINDLYKKWRITATNKRTLKDDDRNYDLHIKQSFGARKVSSLTTSQVRSWHYRLTKKPRMRKKNGMKVTLSKGTANRCLALLRSMYNAEATEIPNPCKGVKMFPEESRDRFIKPHEMKAFFEALQSPETPEMIQDLIKVMLFTGARRMNVLSMQWKELDLEGGVWTIPGSKFKNKRKTEVELIPMVIEILEKRKEKTCSVFVFPSHGKSGHLSDPKKQWKKLIERAGLPDLRMHDLRRTCGAYQANVGSSLIVIGKSLGHLNSKTTEVYARLDKSPIRDSMQKGAEAMLEAINQMKVINIQESDE